MESTPPDANMKPSLIPKQSHPYYIYVYTRIRCVSVRVCTDCAAALLLAGSGDGGVVVWWWSGKRAGQFIISIYPLPFLIFPFLFSLRPPPSSPRKARHKKTMLITPAQSSPKGSLSFAFRPEAHSPPSLI